VDITSAGVIATIGDGQAERPLRVLTGALRQPGAANLAGGLGPPDRLAAYLQTRYVFFIGRTKLRNDSPLHVKVQDVSFSAGE
jgi:hypothetical protein